MERGHQSFKLPLNCDNTANNLNWTNNMKKDLADTYIFIGNEVSMVFFVGNDFIDKLYPRE